MTTRTAETNVTKVTSLDELNTAIQTANSTAKDADTDLTISLEDSNGDAVTITLTSGDAIGILNSAKSVTIKGPSREKFSTIDGNSVARGFIVAAGTVKFRNLKIENCVATGTDGGMGAGGALYLLNPYASGLSSRPWFYGDGSVIEEATGISITNAKITACRAIGSAPTATVYAGGTGGLGGSGGFGGECGLGKVGDNGAGAPAKIVPVINGNQLAPSGYGGTGGGGGYGGECDVRYASEGGAGGGGGAGLFGGGGGCGGGGGGGGGGAVGGVNGWGEGQQGQGGGYGGAAGDGGQGGYGGGGGGAGGAGGGGGGGAGGSEFGDEAGRSSSNADNGSGGPGGIVGTTGSPGLPGFGAAKGNPGHIAAEGGMGGGDSGFSGPGGIGAASSSCGCGAGFGGAIFMMGGSEDQYHNQPSLAPTLSLHNVEFNGNKAEATSPASSAGGDIFLQGYGSLSINGGTLAPNVHDEKTSGISAVPGVVSDATDAYGFAINGGTGKWSGLPDTSASGHVKPAEK